MFGYVTPYKDELKIGEFTLFKSYYCGLCFHIKKEFGNLPRMLLNYDMTFLGLLLDSLQEEEPAIRFQKCLTNPVKKKEVINRNTALAYAAEMNVSLVYYKLLDDIADDKNLKSKAMALTLKPYQKKFSPTTKVINQCIEENLNTLSELEKNGQFSSIDEICHPFALIVAHILGDYPALKVANEKEVRETLFNLGYALGKWIYLIDALDDLEKDMEKHKFNPLQQLYNKEQLSYAKFLPLIKEKVGFTLLNCGYNCKAALKSLPIERNQSILENIIILGMMKQYERVSTHCECKNKKGGKQKL